MLPDMSGIGHRVKIAREAKGMSLKELARLADGLRYQTIQDLENGKSKGTKHVLAIARALGVSPDWLQTGSGDQAARPEKGHNLKENNTFFKVQPPVPSHGASGDRLPVYGMATGGPDGWNLFNGDLIETVPMPANLLGVRGAYAVYINGSSMEPRYKAGEMAHIHPHKPVTIGAYVLVQKRSKEPGEPPLAVIKELVRRSGSKIVLAQINPPKTFEIKLDEIVSIHRVVGSSEA